MERRSARCRGGAAPGAVGVFGCQGVGRPCVCMRVCVCLFVVARGDRSRPLVIAGPGGIPPHFLGWRLLPCPWGLGVLGAWDLWLGCPAASPGGLGVGPLLPLGLGCPGAFPPGPVWDLGPRGRRPFAAARPPPRAPTAPPHHITKLTGLQPDQPDTTQKITTKDPDEADTTQKITTKNPDACRPESCFLIARTSGFEPQINEKTSHCYEILPKIDNL